MSLGRVAFAAQNVADDVGGAAAQLGIGRLQGLQHGGPHVARGRAKEALGAGGSLDRLMNEFVAGARIAVAAGREQIGAAVDLREQHGGKYDVHGSIPFDHGPYDDRSENVRTSAPARKVA